MIVPFCSNLMRSHLEYCIRIWDPHQENDMELLEWIQRAVVKMIRGMEHSSYKKKLEGDGLVEPGEKKTLGRPSETLKELINRR